MLWIVTRRPNGRPSMLAPCVEARDVLSRRAMKKCSFLVLAVIGCARIGAADANADAQGALASMPTLYVEEFQPVSGTSHELRPLRALTSGVHSYRVDKNAAALSKALVQALLNAHVAAEALPSNRPRPQTGWLLRGVYYSLDPDGHLLPIPFLNRGDAPNVEVTITLANGAKDPDAPFAILGKDSVLKGQGAPVGWNPYVVAARFIVNRFEGDKSLNDLANQIAQQIVGHSADLLNRDAARP